MGKNYNIKKYHRAVDFIESMAGLYTQHGVRKERKNKIYKEFLRKLGEPQNDYKIIHVTGTAGKGSVCSQIHAALVKAGYNAGLYLSPHTTSAVERIKLNDRYIPAEAFYNILDKIKPTFNKVSIPPDFFGILVAIAFQYFSEEKCDYVVLEVGAGGQYDHTNVIPSPVIAIATNVGHDHTEYLGKTLVEIARHKAGIIKKHCTFITSDTNPKVLKIFKDRCKKVNAKYIHVNPNGAHYTDINTKVAQKAIDVLGVDVKINKSLVEKSSRLPCRQEIIQKKPTIMLDGAHNPSKMNALVSTIKKVARPDYLIIGISANKDWRRILKTIVPHAKKIILTKYVASRRTTVSPIKMKKYINKHFPSRKPIIYWDPLDALRNVIKKSKKDDFILITGSMYLTGELRTYWIPEENILQYRSSFKNGNSNGHQ
ncbi:MAG: Mur ligase family protein [Candidatus Komeilibacteria bacterium]